MVMDFAAILLLLAIVSGVIYALDVVFWRRERVARGGKEPLMVEYARSFFPIIVIVLGVRSFLFEPFRIPSDSMMPTLLDGDFIFVNKFAYGLRLPVFNTKIVPISNPARGDVIVFSRLLIQRNGAGISTLYIRTNILIRVVRRGNGRRGAP